MITRSTLALAMLAACSVPDKQPRVDDETVIESTDGGVRPVDARLADASIDVPPPTVDAGPPPTGECNGNGNGMQCELPAPACLDAHYILQYTGADCMQGQCVFMREYVYCASGCSAGVCL